MSELRRHRHDLQAHPPKLQEQVQEPRRSLPATTSWLVPTDPPAV